MHAESTHLDEKVFRWILLGITIFAFVIRLVSIDHNLPYQIISDEGSDLTSAVRLLQGELPAEHVRYHRSLIAYNNIFAIAGVFVVNFIDGDVRSIADFQDLYFSDRAQFVFATRLWMSVLTSGAVFFTGLAASYVNRRVGLFAALILALNAFYFHTSLFALPDALGASMTALCIWSIMRVWKYRHTRDYVIMSIALALVMLSKLQASIIGVGFLVAHAYIVFDKVNGDWKRLPLAYITDKNIWIAAITGILANVILNPLGFIDPSVFLYEIRLTLGNFGEVNAAPSFSQNLDKIVEEITTLIVVMWRWNTVFIVLALIPLWKRKLPAPNVIIFAMLIMLMALIQNARLNPVSHFYYWNPVVIPIAIMAGIGAGYLLEILSVANRKYAQYLVVGMVGLIVILEGSFLLQMFKIMNSETTQELAREWIVENIEADVPIISGSPIIISVPITRNETSILRAIELENRRLEQWDWYLAQAIDERPTPTFDLYGPEYLEVVDTFDDLSALIESESIQYIVFTDYACSGQDDDPSNNSTLSYPPRSSAMTENWELVYSISSYASGECDYAIHPRTKVSFSEAIYGQVRMGPYIEIYRIPSS